MCLKETIACYTPCLKTHCRRPQLEAPVLVSQYIEGSLALAKWYGSSHCTLLQELYLKRVFNELLNKIADPLVHESIRKQCFEQLYKPLLALKRFYKQQQADKQKYLALELEARVLCREFNPFL
ncbi:hypothetical protein AAEU28_12215 [Pseudoalteromonas sp. SS15]|jgi:hypothetical protein|nr:hypothetical protein [Pseudoalteromonas phenolica O-BC30]|tara:strand:- start:148 stop:519 length:372 start_codon:yes stop_codon:yes gene_type:complete